MHSTFTNADSKGMAEAIVAAHAGRFGDADASAQPPSVAAPAPVPAQRRSTVHEAAYAAATTLGFIAIDAACLADAWEAMTERLGRFDPAAWPDEPADFDLRPPHAPPRFPACPEALGLYAVLPDAAWVGRMARAGVPTVQLRFKSDDAEAIAREVQAAVAAVEGTGALLFINDHWQAAIAAGAYGVHLGQEDLEDLKNAELDAIARAGLRLGVSTHGYAEMVRADAVAPSYIALGAVYPTTLKRMATAPQGTDRLTAYARLLRHYPLVAIGGIDEARLPEVLKSGVGSVALVRAVTGADDPEAAAARLQAAMHAALSLPKPLMKPAEFTIYHNPACSNSRGALALLRDAGIEPAIIEYLKTPPSRDALQALARQPGLSARMLLREKEPLCAELGLLDPACSDDAVLDAIAAHPVLLNRPVVVSPRGARVCRPPETVAELLPPT